MQPVIVVMLGDMYPFLNLTIDIGFNEESGKVLPNWAKLTRSYNESNPFCERF